MAKRPFDRFVHSGALGLPPAGGAEFDEGVRRITGRAVHCSKVRHLSYAVKSSSSRAPRPANARQQSCQGAADGLPENRAHPKVPRRYKEHTMKKLLGLTLGIMTALGGFVRSEEHTSEFQSHAF